MTEMLSRQMPQFEVELPITFPDVQHSTDELHPNANRLLSYALGQRNIDFEGLNNTDTATYFQDVIFPELKNIYDIRNKQKILPSREQTLEKSLSRRFSDIANFISGQSLDEIAHNSGRIESGVKFSIFSTMRLLRSKDVNLSIDDFKTELQTQFPNCVIAERATTRPLCTARAAGKTALAGNRKQPDPETELYVDADLTRMYLSQIGKEPLLEAEQEVELSKRIEAGLVAEQVISSQHDRLSGIELEELAWIASDGEAAKDQFQRANLRLVVSIAKKYGYNTNLGLLDKIQEGNFGLMHAVEKFDYTKGYKFSTYASWWVRQAIARGIAQQGRVVRLPMGIVEQISAINSERRILEKRGIEPTPELVAGSLNMEVGRVNDLLNWSRDHISLEAPLDDDGGVIGDLMVYNLADTTEATVIDNEKSREMWDHISLLGDERLIDIISSRHGLKTGAVESQAYIGKRYGISAERVRQLEKEALNRLRTFYEVGTTTLQD